MAATTSAAGQKLSRDDWRKRKELEEARKAGTAPAEVDEEGRDINPHIPQYISQAPWYVSLGRPSLTHQRPQEEKQKDFSSINEWYQKGTQKKSAIKFRKGACENCGSMTHQKKDCLERPRKVGAKFTGQDIRPDEHNQPQLSFTWDAKRDRWNGYDPDDHQQIIEEYQKIEMAKRQLKAEKLQTELLSGNLSETAIKEKLASMQGDSDNSDEDEEKYADQADMPGTKFDSKTRHTVRNLRIREDTAKYLHNLDPNSAYYDPKTRSMRENPFKNSNKDSAQLQFAGDNFVRHSGDIKDFARSQMFAWEAYEHGTDIHPLADPTKLEVMNKEFRVKKETFKGEQQQSILERYGGEEHLDAPPKELLLAQTEHYVEYSQLGNVIKGQEKAVAKSKYEEDVHTNNHTSVWGSFWEEGRWGYACCYSLIKGSYCTGEAGKLARKAGQRSSFMVPKPGEEEEGSEGEDEGGESLSLLEQHRAKRSKKSKRELKEEQKRREEQEEVEKEKRLREAIQAEELREKEVERVLSLDERKRPYHSMRAEEGRVPTEEEMEAYRLKKRRTDDPMTQFLENR